MKKYPRSLALAAFLLLTALALLAVACGGTEDTAETTATPVVDGVEIKGLVDDPVTLDVSALEAMDVVQLTVEDPKAGTTECRGVRLAELFSEVGVQESATVVNMAASDGYMVEIGLSDLQASADALLAIDEDGTMRVIIPDMPSKNWVKDVVTIEFK